MASIGITGGGVSSSSRARATFAARVLLVSNP
jgi:hypothetical protein